MYCIEKLIDANEITLQELLDNLSKFNKDAKIKVCGSDGFYIHCTPSEDCINIDTEMLDYVYDTDCLECTKCCKHCITKYDKDGDQLYHYCELIDTGRSTGYGEFCSTINKKSSFKCPCTNDCESCDNFGGCDIMRSKVDKSNKIKKIAKISGLSLVGLSVAATTIYKLLRRK